MSQSASDSSRFGRSDWITLWSSAAAMNLYRKVSSAKSLAKEDTLAAKSFMLIRNRQGPRTDPDGTPDLTGMYRMYAVFDPLRKLEIMCWLSF